MHAHARLRTFSKSQDLTLLRLPNQAMAQRGDPTYVRFLGTGCAEPSKYRGGSAIHVRLANDRGLLLDAGEGVWGQFLRHYGPEGARAQARPVSFLSP
jgi:ribonuclease Z